MARSCHYSPNFWLLENGIFFFPPSAGFLPFLRTAVFAVISFWHIIIWPFIISKRLLEIYTYRFVGGSINFSIGISSVFRNHNEALRKGFNFAGWLKSWIIKISSGKWLLLYFRYFFGLLDDIFLKRDIWNHKVCLWHFPLMQILRTNKNVVC